MEDYQEYLESEHWKKLRSKVITTNTSCFICLKRHSLLPHHLDYKSLNHEKLFKWFKGSIVVVCYDCHKELHYWKFLWLFPTKIPLVRDHLVRRLFELKYKHSLRRLDLLNGIKYFLYYAISW